MVGWFSELIQCCEPQKAKVTPEGLALLEEERGSEAHKHAPASYPIDHLCPATLLGLSSLSVLNSVSS